MAVFLANTALGDLDDDDDDDDDDLDDNDDDDDRDDDDDYDVSSLVVIRIWHIDSAKLLSKQIVTILRRIFSFLSQYEITQMHT